MKRWRKEKKRVEKDNNRQRKRSFQVLVVRALDKFDFASAACLGLSIQSGLGQGGGGQECESMPTLA